MARCKYIFKDGNKCQTTAIYNYKDEKQGNYCSKHKKENMINIRNKKCEEVNCETLPTFNYEGNKEGKYCKEHKKKRDD